MAVRRDQLKLFFFTALELPPSERAGFVARLPDAEIRIELENLLKAHSAAGTFLEGGVPGALLESTSLVPGRRLGPYEIVGLIGRGGIGEVYRARDTRLGRHVALKVLSHSGDRATSRQRRFEEEARSASALNHPNVLTVYDVGVVDDERGSSFIVMELLDGETLRARLEREPVLPRAQVIDFALQIARGMAAAHAAGIVHRDLKPENLFVTTDGRIKILDFGLAKVTEADSERTVTLPGRVMGTAGYIAPEQVTGAGSDARSDIFAYGTVLYEMVTGARAFSGPSVVDALNAILKTEPLDARAVAEGREPDLLAIARHAIAKRPEDRFQSATDVIASLVRLPLETPARTSSLRVAVTIALAVVVVAAAIAAAMWW